MTSMAVAEAIQRRLQMADVALAIQPPPLRIRAHDIALAMVIATALLVALAAVLSWKYQALHGWMIAGS